jgi:DNA topoisomerase VI subunit B
VPIVAAPRKRRKTSRRKPSSMYGEREEWVVTVRHGTNHRNHVWRKAYSGGEEAARAAFDATVMANPEASVLLLDPDGRRERSCRMN